MSKLRKKDYDELLEPMKLELNNLARWLQHTGTRMLVILEGRETSGKGGTIHALTEILNPRQVHVVALAKPSDREQTQWYFQRYVPYLPAAGELVLFDRSWYNRAGVEKVMGFCTADQYRRFLKDAPTFERLLTDDGILIYKYWLAVDQRWQEERFAERAADPRKRWKLSSIDLEARERYVEYGRSRDAMFKATHTRWAPWTVVDYNDQRRGRLTLIRHLLDSVPVTTLPAGTFALPPLGTRHHKERYRTSVKPIRSRY